MGVVARRVLGFMELVWTPQPASCDSQVYLPNAHSTLHDARQTQMATPTNSCGCVQQAAAHDMTTETAPSLGERSGSGAPQRAAHVSLALSQFCSRVAYGDRCSCIAVRGHQLHVTSVQSQRVSNILVCLCVRLCVSASFCICWSRVTCLPPRGAAPGNLLDIVKQSKTTRVCAVLCVRVFRCMCECCVMCERGCIEDN